MNDISYLTNNGVDVESGIEFLGDLESYKETLGEFLNLVDKKVENLETCKAANDLENYSIYAHSIKSDARYLGFIKLSEIALKHETQSKALNKDYINTTYNEFLAEIKNAKEIAKNYLGDAAIQGEKEERKFIESDKAVLIVDDSEIIRDFLFKILGQEYECIMADNGNKAIEILEGPDFSKIKAMFLDLNMPGCNGFDVLEYFKEKNLFDKCPISIITGADDKESIDKAFKYPIIDMLVKPFNEKDVRRIVERTVAFKN